jgi:hypothetical protein
MGSKAGKRSRTLSRIPPKSFRTPRNGPLRESDRPEGLGHGRTRIVRTGPDWGQFAAPCGRSFIP